jgi:hypothetical protein
VKDMQVHFKDGLGDKCKAGAANVRVYHFLNWTKILTSLQAAAAAVETHDGFSLSMHWGTYRASE